MEPPDKPDFTPLRQILDRAALKYLDVRATGIEIDGELNPVRTAVARIYDFGGARTLYVQRKPSCRSLDGVTSITRKDHLCADCLQRHACTPQVRVDMLIGAQSYRCLLAYTSATNFLVYESVIRREGFEFDRVDTQITVVDRGTWGEMRFRRLES
jgi:hypothetical protein